SDVCSSDLVGGGSVCRARNCLASFLWFESYGPFSWSLAQLSVHCDETSVSKPAPSGAHRHAASGFPSSTSGTGLGHSTIGHAAQFYRQIRIPMNQASYELT